jgi:hypothetical protein
MHDILDLDRYPLDRLDSPEGIALVARCKADLAAHGMFNLDHLLMPCALTRAVTEVKPVLDSASFTHRRSHNIHFRNQLPGLALDHPALKLCETVNHTICVDQIPGSTLMRLYEWPPFAAFLAAVMEKPVLHTMADPLARLNVMAYRDGEALNWHFDRSEFTTTLLLRAPEGGGEFKYRTDLRTGEDPNYDGVARLLEGADSAVERLRLDAGALNVFRGKNTAHRVTPVTGPRERIIAVFSFYERPGVEFSEEECIGFYGRAA